MDIVRSRMKCVVCGHERNVPRAGVGEKVPIHCGDPMDLVRDLRCAACGHEATNVLSLGLQPVGATVNARPPPSPAAATLPAAVADLAGRTWAGYQVVSTLGRGGMAIVYKAYQPNLERHVAIKFLLHGPSDPTLIDRFKQEARLVAHLRHPNIVTVLDFGEDQGIPYLVMEYVEGETLLARLGEPMTLSEALSIAGQVAAALDYAHRHGVVHRDVKPSNILLAEEGCVLSDFGIAKPLEGAAHLTQTGVTIGTPEYMSPEQCQGLPVDARSDIYSLGVVLYEMLTGRPPFVGPTSMSVMLKHVGEPLPPPRRINPSIPPEVEAAVLRATAKDPAERYTSAAEMAAAVAALGDQRTTLPRVASRVALPTVQETPARPGRFWIAVAAFAVLGIVALGAALMLGGSREPAPIVRTPPPASPTASPLPSPSPSPTASPAPAVKPRVRTTPRRSPTPSPKASPSPTLPLPLLTLPGQR